MLCGASYCLVLLAAFGRWSLRGAFTRSSRHTGRGTIRRTGTRKVGGALTPAGISPFDGSYLAASQIAECNEFGDLLEGVDMYVIEMDQRAGQVQSLRSKDDEKWA